MTNFLNQLKHVCQFIGYCEVEPHDERIKWSNDASTLYEVFDNVPDPNVKQVKIQDKIDIWPAFKKFFGGVS